MKFEKVVTINREPEDVFLFWRRLENLPVFMEHLESVTQRPEGISHWVIRTDKGRTLEWDAQIIEEKPMTMFAWQSAPDADVDSAGSVWFTPAPGGRGTVVKVSLKYSPAGGKFGASLARLQGDGAEKQIAADLFRLKSLLEAGEIPTVEGQPHGDAHPKTKSKA